MAKCKNPECKKDAIDGEEYCCACRDKKDRHKRGVLKCILLAFVAIGAGAFHILKSGKSASL